MQESVLTLGERIVLAARLATIEHIRLEMADAELAAAYEPAINDASYRQLAEVFERALIGSERGAA